MTGAAPATATPVVPPVAPAEVAVVVPPALKPLIELPDITLPEEVEKLTVMATVLSGLHLIEEQDLEARAAYPVCWGTVAAEGMDKEMLTSLLPPSVLPAGDDAADHVPIPQRTLSALRRQLDRMSAKWDVKHAELLVSQKVQAGAAAMFAGVMDQAKRIQRKRVPSMDNKQLEAETTA